MTTTGYTPNQHQFFQCNLNGESTKLSAHENDIVTKNEKYDGKSVSNCILTGDGQRSQCVPTKVALQILTLEGQQAKYFPKDRLNRDKLAIAGRASALSQFAYYHHMKIGDRFYDGKVVQIVRFPSKMADGIDSGELFGYRWESDDGRAAAIVFRGTDDPKNWSIDFNAKAVDIDCGCKGKMHGGMYHAVHNYLNHWKTLFRDIDFTHGYSLMITGHSLGVGLAHATLFELQCNPIMSQYKQRIGQGRLEVYGFGAPATFDRQLRDTLMAKSRQIDILSFCKEDDPITFIGAKAETFLRGVLEMADSSLLKRVEHFFERVVEQRLSISQQYIRMKLGKYPYNKGLLEKSLHDVNYYVHLGTLIETEDPNAGFLANHIHLLEHAEYLNVHHSNLKDNGNNGWYCAQPRLRRLNEMNEINDVSHAAFYSIIISVFVSLIISLLFSKR